MSIIIAGHCINLSIQTVVPVLYPILLKPSASQMAAEETNGLISETRTKSATTEWSVPISFGRDNYVLICFFVNRQ